MCLPKQMKLHLLILASKSLHTCVLSYFSRVQLFATPWTIACQAPLSMGFSRQEYWRGLPFPSWGDLPSLGIQPESPVAPALQMDSLLLSHEESPIQVLRHLQIYRLCFNIQYQWSVSSLFPLFSTKTQAFQSKYQSRDFVRCLHLLCYCWLCLVECS